MLVFLPAIVTRYHSSESGANHLDTCRFGFQCGESIVYKSVASNY